MGYEKQMTKHPLERGYPNLAYISKNLPRTKSILKKFILSNFKKPDLFSLAKICLKELGVYKFKNYENTIKKLAEICSRNVYYNSYHDQHHIKTVVIISCILAKKMQLKYRDKVLLIIIALTHDMNHQGRRVLQKIPYYQEKKSCKDLERILFKKILCHKQIKRIRKIFQSTYFPVKPQKVSDNLEKIVLDADILASLMFGPSVGMKLAGRLKQEIRYENDTELLFTNFLKLLGDKCLYLDYSKNSC